MNLKVLFFGRVSDAFGPQIAVDIPPATIADLRLSLGAEALAGARAAINRQIVTDAAAIAPGDEVAFFSMLSGG